MVNFGCWRAGDSSRAARLRLGYTVHARAKRIHAGNEGIAPRGAALHTEVIHEDRAFIGDTVYVWRAPDHQASVVAAWLHKAYVVGHDEEDVRFLFLRLKESGCADERGRRCQ